MRNWNPNQNWTYEEYKNVVSKALIHENKNSITLDTEHSDYHNEQQIVAWAKNDGYKAEIEGESITISKKSRQGFYAVLQGKDGKKWVK